MSERRTLRLAVCANVVALSIACLSGQEQSLDELIEQLRSATVASERIQTIQATEKLGPKAAKAVPELARLLSAKDSAIQRSAVYALGAIGPQALPAAPQLNALRYSRNESLWSGALLQLPKLGPAVIVDLVDAVEHDAAIRPDEKRTRTDADIRAWDRRAETTGSTTRSLAR